MTNAKGMKCKAQSAGFHAKTLLPSKGKTGIKLKNARNKLIAAAIVNSMARKGLEAKAPSTKNITPKAMFVKGPA